MKRVISLLMVAILLFLCGCKEIEDEKEQDNLILTEYLNNIDEYETPVREFGKPTSYIHMDEKMVIGILYPETDIEYIDKEITDWIDEIVAEYTKEVDSKENQVDTAELTVSYGSYNIGKSTVSIKMSGTFFAPYLAHPIDIIKTFNADTETKQLLKIEDILKEGSLKDFQDMVVSVAEIDPEVVDDALLDNAVLTKDGIEIILSRGDYLPMSDGTVTLFFKYAEIKDLLKSSFDYKTQKNDGGAGEQPPVTTEKPDRQTIDPSKPMIALTFDDGPSVHTERLLDVLKENGGKGTFFVLGNLIDGRENTLKRIVAEDHEVGNHSWNHRQLTNLSDEEIKDQIMITRAKIYDVTGKDCLIMRPPYGACNDSVRAVGAELGVSFVNWSVDTLDWKSKNADAVYNEIMEYATDGAIILCHDLHKTTVDAMERAIPDLLEEGYQLVTVSELMSYSENKLEPGKMYYKQ